MRPEGEGGGQQSMCWLLCARVYNVTMSRRCFSLENFNSCHNGNNVHNPWGTYICHIWPMFMMGAAGNFN